MGQISTGKTQVTRTATEANRLQMDMLLAIRKTGSIELALDKLGLTQAEFDFWQSNSPEFAEQVKSHILLSDLDVLNTVRSRAIDGIDKPVIFKGAVVFHRVPPTPPEEPYDPEAEDEDMVASGWADYLYRSDKPHLWPFKHRPPGEVHPVYGPYYPVMETQYDNNLLLRLAAQIDPSLNPSSQVHHSGHIRHTSTRKQATDTGKLPKMDRAKRNALRQALEEALGAESTGQSEPEDADFVIVEDAVVPEDEHDFLA
jgi:hypothetical protein